MSSSFTFTDSTTFTVTHARHIAAKVATDLKRLQRLYGSPSDQMINKYEEEVITLLKHGYLESVSYGYQRDDRWIEPSLHYTASDFDVGTNDDPGRIRPGADIGGASFYSYLTYTQAWYDDLPDSDDKLDFKQQQLPFVRNGADEPGIDGYLTNDRTYASGGKSLARATVRSY